jgi:hypothetical protein
MACRRVSNDRALRPEKLASASLAVNSVRLEHSLEAGFFVGVMSCDDVVKPLTGFTPFRLVEALALLLVRAWQRTVLDLELALNRREHL